jgi:hypothetical protein
MYAVKLNNTTTGDSNRTQFSTTEASGLSPGDYVYIYGGLFDNVTKLATAKATVGSANTLKNLYLKESYALGYKVFSVSGNNITLDIPYTGENNSKVSLDSNEPCYISKTRFVTGRVLKSTWNGGIFGNSILDTKYAQVGQTNTKTTFNWNRGVFAGGILQRGIWGSVSDSKYRTWLSGVFGNSATNALQSDWNGGEFLGGTWINGTFNYGSMSSLYSRITWHNGTLIGGQFYDVHWKDGIFESGGSITWETFKNIKISRIAYDVPNNKLVITVTDATKHRLKWFKSGDLVQITGIQGGLSNSHSLHMHSAVISTPDITDNTITIPFNYSGETMPDANYFTYTDAHVTFSQIEKAVINGGVFVSTRLKNDANVICNNGTFLNIVWTGGDFVSGYVTSKYLRGYSKWLGGTLKGGTLDSTVWYNGTAEAGVIQYSEWYNGSHTGGEMSYTTWHNGTFTGGKFIAGSWLDGTFNVPSTIEHSMEGTQSSEVYWNNGTFQNGSANLVRWDNGIFNGGKLSNSSWYNGTFNNGNADYLTWHNGTFNNGTFAGGTWNAGTWNAGTFNNSIWNNGTWETGNFNNSTWYDGTWENGTFSTNSDWKNGTWRNGTFRDYSTWRNGYWYNGSMQEIANFESGIFMAGELKNTIVGLPAVTQNNDAFIFKTTTAISGDGNSLNPNSKWYKRGTSINTDITISMSYQVNLSHTTSNDNTYHVNYFPAKASQNGHVQDMSIAAGKYVLIQIFNTLADADNDPHNAVLSLPIKLDTTQANGFISATSANAVSGSFITVTNTNQVIASPNGVKFARLIVFSSLAAIQAYYSIESIQLDTLVNMGNAIKAIMKIKIENKFNVQKALSIRKAISRVYIDSTLKDTTEYMLPLVPGNLPAYNGVEANGLYEMAVYMKADRGSGGITFYLENTPDFLIKDPSNTGNFSFYMDRLNARLKVPYTTNYNMWEAGTWSNPGPGNGEFENTNSGTPDMQTTFTVGELQLQFAIEYDGAVIGFDTKPIKIRKDGTVAMPTKVLVQVDKLIIEDYANGYTANDTETAVVEFEVRQMSSNVVILANDMVLRQRRYSTSHALTEEEKTTYGVYDYRYTYTILGTNDEVQPGSTLVSTSETNVSGFPNSLENLFDFPPKVIIDQG